MKFDKKTLPKEIQEFLKAGGIAQAYSVSTQISGWLEENPEPDVNTLLCAAHYAWACADLTELDDDVIDFGEEAIELLDRVLAIDAANEEALKQKAKLQKKVKKAKREQQEMLKWEKQDINEMNRGVLGELAFYYFVKAEQSPEFAEKGYRYYAKIYEQDLLEDELPRDSLYHFATMAYCKYYSEGYELAKELIKQALDWELTDRYKIYDFKITDVWMIELNYLASQDDLVGFQQSFERWYQTMKAILPDKEPSTSRDSQLLNPIVKWLFSKGETTIRRYILTHCYSFLVKKKMDLDNEQLVVSEIEGKSKQQR